MDTKNNWKVVVLALFLLSCRTRPEISTEKVVSSSHRDTRVLEQTIDKYSFRLNDLNSFTSQVDWTKYFEDVESKERTNYVDFKYQEDTKCTVGLTNKIYEFLKTHPDQPFTAKSIAPGRTSSFYHSQIVLTFSGDKRQEEILISCSQENRRLSISDFANAVGDLVLLSSVSDGNPKYEVCCECITDTISESNELIKKGETNHYKIKDANDSICKTKITGMRTDLRPGDELYDALKPRKMIWTKCVEVAQNSCQASPK